MWGRPDWLHELCDSYRLLCGDNLAGFMNCVIVIDFCVGTTWLAS